MGFLIWQFHIKEFIQGNSLCNALSTRIGNIALFIVAEIKGNNPNVHPNGTEWRNSIISTQWITMQLFKKRWSMSLHADTKEQKDS